jgi:hypothetical protein
MVLTNMTIMGVKRMNFFMTQMTHMTQTILDILFSF